jgi:hypothetical protein
MHHPGIAPLILSAALLAVGCAKNEVRYAKTDAELVEAMARDKSLADSIAADAKRKDEYARDIRRQLDEFDKKYAELRNRAVEAEGQTKMDLESKIAQAKVKRDAAARKLDELKDASSTRWKSCQDEMASALADVKKVFE